ncbi:MAG TPA: holin [Pseudobacteroides sp.]|uniref:holin n=1 Tax=Pseudobacteroides sp. TaxID=1968840 RepID=UPI002F935267
MANQQQSRWRSKAAWVSTITLIVFVLKTYFKVEVPKVDELIDLVLLAATAWGVFNNPTNKKGF